MAVTALEKCARAIKAEIGRSFDAKPLTPQHGSPNDDWFASGDIGILDTVNIARAVLTALRRNCERWQNGQRSRISTLDSLNEAEMVEGYRSAERGDPEPGQNRGKAFWHGWRNRMIDMGEIKGNYIDDSLKP